MKILRLKQVIELTGLSRSTIYLFIQNQQFPIQVKLSSKMVGWVEAEVTKWIHDRIEFRDAEKLSS